MKNKWLLYLVLFLLAINAAMVTTLLIKGNPSIEDKDGFIRRHRQEFQGQGHSRFETYLSNELKLDENQEQKITAFSREFHNKQRSNRHEVFRLQKEYFELLSQINPDSVILNKIALEIGNIEALKIKLEYNHYRNVRSVCNSEQALKMDSLGRMHMQHRHRNRSSEGKYRQRN